MYAGGKIVNVSSSLSQLRNLNKPYQDRVTSAMTLNDLRTIAFDSHGDPSPRSWPAYSLSKAMLNRATQILAQHPDFRQLSINAADPGWCRYHGYPYLMSLPAILLWHCTLKPLQGGIRLLQSRLKIMAIMHTKQEGVSIDRKCSARSSMLRLGNLSFDNIKQDWLAGVTWAVQEQPGRLIKAPPQSWRFTTCLRSSLEGFSTMGSLERLPSPACVVNLYQGIAQTIVNHSHSRIATNGIAIALDERIQECTMAV